MHVGEGVVSPLRGYHEVCIAIACRAEVVVNIVAKEEHSGDQGVWARAVHKNNNRFTISISKDLEGVHG